MITLTPKQREAAEKAWAERAARMTYISSLPLEAATEVLDGEDFRGQQLSPGDRVLVATKGYGQIYSGEIWKIMGIGRGVRNYFVWVPALGRMIIRGPYIARDPG